MGTGPVFQLTDAWLQATFPDLHNTAPLGQGGQKLVFSATHSHDGEVVLKLFQPSQSVEEVQREILAVQQVGAPKVPAILDHGSVPTPLGNVYWLRERRIAGTSLRDRLSHGPLPPREVVKLGRDVLESLVRAEQVAIVHRDVKPDNIIIDGAGVYWLLDFGLARHLSLSSLTASAQPLGKITLGYGPPEQCRNDKPSIDSRADLFALGVTLYEAATGTNPFLYGARDALEVLRRIEHLPLAPLALPLVDSDSFRDLIAAMTQKRRDHRPASAAEALQWLHVIATNEGL